MSEVEGEEAIGRGSGEANVVEMLWERVALERRKGKLGGRGRASGQRGQGIS